VTAPPAAGGEQRAGTGSVGESWQTRLTRWKFNWYPAYRGTGARVTYIAADWREVRVRLPLNWRTRNIVGTIFGGSLYGAIDPFYMIMLIRVLGPDYVVWDKAATIRFLEPGRETLRATFRLTDEDIARIRADVDRLGKAEPEFTVELLNAAGQAQASCRKLLSVRRRQDAVPR
jgi:acyl-coenzyme A thioesterase PaaI-like protein